MKARTLSLSVAALGLTVMGTPPETEPWRRQLRTLPTVACTEVHL